MHPLVIHFLHIVHLMLQKINSVVIEVKICNLRYKTPNQIPVVLYNSSTYDYHFEIKNRADEFEGQIECSGEDTEKYISFSVIIKKELDNGKIATNKIKFVDCFRFILSS